MSHLAHEQMPSFRSLSREGFSAIWRWGSKGRCHLVNVPTLVAHSVDICARQSVY